MIVSYCSNCLKKAKHRLVKDPLIGKDVYECSKCGHRAYKCSICDNLAIEDENNKEGLFCAEHFGTIGAFDRVDDRIDDISDFRKLFVDDKNLTTEEKQLRQGNLEALDKGFFELLILAGSSVSEYVRQIITSACMSDIDISLYADEDSLLTRYLHMQQSGRV